jgi:hypothetical protein
MVCGNAFLFPVFYFKTRGNELVDLIGDLKVPLRELLIKIVAWIGVPNEACDRYKKLTVSSQPGIAGLQECEGSVTDSRVL